VAKNFQKRNSRYLNGRTKKVAARQTVVGVPVVVEPIEVQNPPVAVPVEIRDVAIIVGVAQSMRHIVNNTTP